MSLEAEIDRGKLAEDVLANPVYLDGYTLIEQEITRLWRESRDAGEREELHRLLKSLDKVKSAMESAMRSGRIALDELQKRASLAQRIGRTLTRS